MSLFFAVPAPEGVRAHLEECAADVSRVAPEASLVRPGNWHVTLEFLGRNLDKDEDAVARAKAALDALEPHEFSFEVQGMSYFTTREPNHCIVWAHVEEVHELRHLREDLRDLLVRKGFKLGHQEFRPHVTLARKVNRIAAAELMEIEFPEYSYFAPAEKLQLLHGVPAEDGSVRYEPLATKALA